MSTRELPDFLKRGDADLGAPRAGYPGMQIGKGTMRREGVPEPSGGDALSAREWAVRDWLERVPKRRQINQACIFTASVQ